MPRVSKEAYLRVCIEILKALDVPEDKGRILAENLARSDIRGIYSH